MNLNWNRQKQEKAYSGQPRYGFTLTHIPFLKSLLLYGGTHSKSNDIYLYNLDDKKWKIHKVNSHHKPTPRKHHTAYYTNQIRGLIICGGEAQKSRSLNNIQILLMKEKQWEWKKLFMQNSFPARTFHTFTPINLGKQFFIFGGISLPYGTFLNDSWILKNVNSLEKKDKQTLSIIGTECQKLQTKGHIPSTRCGHKAYSVGQNVYVFGGQAQTYEERFSMYILSLSANIWSRHVFNINLLQIINFSLIPNPQNPSQVLIMGGMFVKKKKNNRSVYSVLLNSKNIKKIEDSEKQLDQEILNNCFQTPQGCFGCAWIQGKNQTHPHLYSLQIGDQQESLSIQAYLKPIKSEQLLSQELIKKVANLQVLYMQIQGYISTLYKQYGDGYQQDIEVQEQKQRQIQHCVQLKQDYSKLESIYQQNLEETKLARRDVVSLNDNFEECMETQFDEEG